MRTNIEIDDKLMKQAMKATGATTKKAAVEATMRLAVQLHKQGEAIRKLRGKIVWRGHDDDWFASDEEILGLRRATIRKADAGAAGVRSKLPAKAHVQPHSESVR
jgi:Arc/MetJ family transcription regulator